MSATQPTSSNQSDLLLWVAGGAIAAVGAAWLIITQPWTGAGSEAPAVTPARAPVAAATTESPAATEPTAGATAPEATLDNPLRMAELAYDAGMLIEPEEYSAWTLFARVVKAEPDNTVARDGLTKVADDLVRRGATALEQGRFDDARTTVERIRASLPDHAGAKALAQKIWPQMDPTLSARAALTLTEPPRVARVEAAAAAPARQQVDPVVQASEAFDKAMAEGRLLTPTDQSAKHYVGVLTQAATDHALTQRARTTLSQEFLSRAGQSMEALDPEAASIWIDEGEALLGGNDEGVRKARAALTEQLIAMESAKPVPASALKVATYVAPVYPQRALERNLEGWVDIEFTVGSDGKTRKFVVTEGSHDSFFRREATDAVAKWRFEPRQFMGRAIEQSSYTRIRFVQ